MSTQKFPAGAVVRAGECQAPYCLDRRADVVPAMCGATYRTALNMDLCAECLADFAAGAPVIPAHVYALATDGLYHEVKAGDPSPSMEVTP
jgi:hypothetical protein